MPLWTLFGLSQGKASTAWPAPGSDHGQRGVLGMPRLHVERCRPECAECAAACPTGAIAPKGHGVELDYGRCIHCQLCVDACPSGAMEPSGDWAYGVRSRADLKTGGASPGLAAEMHAVQTGIRRVFGRSLHVRHVDAGSCNGCESELQALNNPFYNLHRLGIFFAPSPRFADLLLVTGPVTHAMKAALLATYEQMPQPRWVMAAGTCAVSGGMAEGGYACGHGLEGVLPVDIWLPGCPPNPAAFIHALLLLLERQPQHVHGGRHER